MQFNRKRVDPKTRRKISQGVTSYYNKKGRVKEKDNTGRNLALGALGVTVLGAGVLASRRRGGASLKKAIKSPTTAVASVASPAIKPLVSPVQSTLRSSPQRALPPASTPARAKSNFVDKNNSGKLRKKGQMLPGIKKGQEPPVVLHEPLARVNAVNDNAVAFLPKGITSFRPSKNVKRMGKANPYTDYSKRNIKTIIFKRRTR